MTCRVEVATRTAPSEMVLDAVGQFPDHIFVPHKIEHAGAFLAVGISPGMTYLGRERLPKLLDVSLSARSDRGWLD